MLHWYAIIGEDIADSLSRRLAVRASHLERVEQLQQQGRLLLAGPFPAVDQGDPLQSGFSGSLIVAAFDSLEAAQLWADADPYQVAGVYVKVVVKPFKPVFRTP
ncbi:MAG: YciI family protein [Magnetococcales bacterium]|nr:YciI family protein [Magnetococcales bacterium]